MASFAESQLGKRRQRHMISLLMLVLMGLGLVVSLYLLRDVEEEMAQRVEFDPNACVRMLSVGRVYRIERNPRDTGEVWFGTAEAIRVFDMQSATWTRYGLDHGLMSEIVADIAFAGDTAWVATWNGVARFDRATQSFHGPRTVKGLGGQRVLAVEYAPGAGIFYYVDGKGLHRVVQGDSVVERVDVPDLDPTARITCLEMLDGRLCVGAEAGRLLFFDPVEGRFGECAFERERSPKTFVWDVLRHGGRVFVATSDEGVWFADSLSDTLRPMGSFPAKGAYAFVDEHDGFWCGTPFGLWRYHDDGDTWIQFLHPDQKEPTDFQVFSLERMGKLLWYGSMDLGAGYLNTENLEWQHLRSGLTSPNIAALAGNDTLLWVGFGYDGGYLDRIWAESMQFHRNYYSRDSIFDRHIQTLEIVDNRVYYGGYHGFGYVAFDGSGRRLYLDSDSTMPFGDIAAIRPLDSTHLALAGLFGVLQYSAVTDSTRLMPETGGKRITSFFRSGDSLWYGTLARGLYLYDMRTHEEQRVGPPDNDRIVGIAPLGDGRLVAVTKRTGLFTIDIRSGEHERLAIPKGIFGKEMSAYDRHVMTMRQVDGRVWLGTREAGCCILEPDGRWMSITYFDGLPSDQVRAFADSESYVWVGCYGGISRYDKAYLEREVFGRGTGAGEAAER
jgi:ligand-binding sensor domain-containing protein